MIFHPPRALQRMIDPVERLSFQRGGTRMPQSAATQDMFDIVGRITAASDRDAILLELRKAGDHYGFDGFCISGIPLPSERVDPYVMMSGWPDGWLEHYADKNFIHVDPVVRQVQRTTMPFVWSDAPVEADDLTAKTVMHDASSIGLRNGFTIPIYTTQGCNALVTFGAERLDLPAQECAAVHLISIYAHARVRDLMGSVPGGTRRSAPRLAPREIECLSWTAEGKSAWDISMILSLSQRTVEQYLTNAARKLGSSNRAQTVAEALRHKIIA